MNTEDRKQALAQELTNSDHDPDEEERQNKYELFINRITKDEEFPMEALQSMLVASMKEHERQNNTQFTSSKLANMYSQDQYVKELILLQSLKDEAIKEEQKSKGKEAKVKTKSILQTSKTIRSFK